VENAKYIGQELNEHNGAQPYAGASTVTPSSVAVVPPPPPKTNRKIRININTVDFSLA
jgi:hypothetical protein